jgi:hypothetical protein
MVDVFCPWREIPAGSAIQREHLVLIAFPKDIAPLYGVDDLSGVEGKVAPFDIHLGTTSTIGNWRSTQQRRLAETTNRTNPGARNERRRSSAISTMTTCTTPAGRSRPERCSNTKWCAQSVGRKTASRVMRCESTIGT